MTTSEQAFALSRTSPRLFGPTCVPISFFVPFLQALYQPCVCGGVAWPIM